MQEVNFINLNNSIMFWTVLALAILGFILIETLSIAKFNKQTTKITDLWPTIKLFYTLNTFLSSSVAFILMIVICILSTVTGSQVMYLHFTGNLLDGSTPFQVYLFGLGIGIGSQAIVRKLFNIFAKEIPQLDVKNPI